jgi:hypothetical protein
MAIEREGVRAISDAEVAHYRKNGWAKLERLFAPWAIEGLLARAKSRMGPEPMTVSRQDPKERVPDEYNWYSRWDGCSHADDWIKGLSHSKGLATAAALLMGSSVRFYFDHFFVKLPGSRRGGPTPWHQDLPHHPLDRQGVLTIWVALVDIPPEMGTMRFLNGSHCAGLLGRYLNRTDGICLIDENPWVLETYEMSAPIHLKAGDATVHNLMIVHYAPENETDRMRWVYSTQWLPPATRYTGAPNHRTDGLGLQIDRPLEHPRFPVIPT